MPMKCEPSRYSAQWAPLGSDHDVRILRLSAGGRLSLKGSGNSPIEGSGCFTRFLNAWAV